MQLNGIWQVTSLILIMILLLSYHDNPPNGRTGAPFDGHCGNCHTGNNPGGFNGTAKILGLPDTIQPNTTYLLKLEARPISGNPVRGGFQLVVVDKHNQNTGNLQPADAETDTEFFNGRQYLDQRIPKYFDGNPVSWGFKWTAPAHAICQTVKFYFIVNFCNGGGDFGDFPIAFADSVYFNSGVPLSAELSVLQGNSCPEGNSGAASVYVSGGLAPYQYDWSNGATDSLVTGLANGYYPVHISDQEGCIKQDTATIQSFDTIAPVLICQEDVSVCAGEQVNYDWPVFSDNCLAGSLPLVLTSGLFPGSIFPEGVTHQEFLAIDESGNTATCAFNITAHKNPHIELDTLIHDVENAGYGQISVTVSGGAGNYAYSWKKDGILFAAGVEDIQGLFAGVYTLSVQDALGCAAVLEFLILNNTSTTYFPENPGQKLSIRPQPVEYGHFSFEGLGEPPVAIHLYDLQGRLYTFLSPDRWPGPYAVEELPPGVYRIYLRYSTGNTYGLSLLNLP